MKSFNEWLKEKNAIEENIADYTPGFIRTPLQNMGLMGRTTAGQKVRDELDAQDERLASDERRRASIERQNRIYTATNRTATPSTPQKSQSQDKMSVIDKLYAELEQAKKKHYEELEQRKASNRGELFSHQQNTPYLDQIKRIQAQIQKLQ
jgi:hypothetical protein